MLSLNLYYIFHKVALCESFSLAAKQLYVSQSAVSQAVKQLEQQTHTSLFHRHARGVSLTAEGKIFFEYIDSAIRLMESGETKLEQMKHLQAGQLTIAAGDTISEQYLLPHLKAFHNTFPAVKLQVINRTSLKTIDLLRQGQIDLAFINLPLPAQYCKNLNIKECMPVQDIFVAGEAFSSLRNTKVSWEQLTHYPLIMLENASNSRQYVNSVFFKSGITLEPEIELGAYNLLLEFAKIGLGISCVIEEFSKKALDENSLFKIELFPSLPPRHIAICTLENITLSWAAQKFIDFCSNKTLCSH